MHKSKFFSLFIHVLFLSFFFCTNFHLISSESNFSQKGFKETEQYATSDNDFSCEGIHQHNDRQGKCEYAKFHKGCQPKGYIPYLQLFYCRFSPFLGYLLLVMWLLVLFYLLGDTASSYFCVSLEGLSTSLKLSPTIAGVTLLSLGNGAPDVFGSIISFTGDGNTKDIGLNSILGAALFVSSVVVGVISISVSNQGKKISYASKNFTWNIIILLLCLSCLLVIIIIGKINLWGSVGFLCLYFLYVAFIFGSESYSSREEKLTESVDKVAVLPVSTKSLIKNSPDGESELHVPLLSFAADELGNDKKNQLPEQKGSSSTRVNLGFSKSSCYKRVLYILGLPLDMPRKLTIPITSEERWEKPFGVVSTFMAPILLASIWNCHDSKTEIQLYIIAASVGVVSSILLFAITDSSTPPRKYKFIWLSESFLMSITWTYVLAQELVSLMVCLGIVLGISNSVMGLTVLAWGNSLGDLFSNVTMAKNGGPDGTQVAISGCYAGPIFNVVVGLGLSLAFASWAVYPSSFQIVLEDPSIYETFGFLMLGLIWALVVVTNSKTVAIDNLLGFGLLGIYCCFLLLKVSRTLGLLDNFFQH